MFKTGDIVVCPEVHPLDPIRNTDPYWDEEMNRIVRMKGVVKTVFSTTIVSVDFGAGEGEWNFAVDWLTLAGPSLDSEQSGNSFCPVCGHSGTIGFNMFHCSKEGCVNH